MTVLLLAAALTTGAGSCWLAYRLNHPKGDR